ncbi:hypothetical protein CAPTEDRAFT_19151 [Capitella teleta]|uniref:Ras-related protein Rab-1 n=1 Tax=Capitella teleta TaxID=283909 RepID=R7UFL0_CAPTE|nr:hypothetical protein CAPTEDRAFT_19151 [Capitella teleta]|eukprot:ELU04995.1 hypothetical protein CAPTEDRAFT_19151 [Capitella teleta]
MNGDPSSQLAFKILVLGDSSVGKTCLIHRYCDDTFYETYVSTIGIDCKQRETMLDQIPVRLRIWDTAGQERFRTLTTAYYRGAQGILLVFDITNEDSFSHLSYWLKNIEEMGSADICKVLVGNKCDLEKDRAVPTDRATKLAKNFGVKFFETSCKTNECVTAAFEYLASMIKAKADEKLEKHGSLQRAHSWHKDSFKKQSWCAC